MAKRNFRRIVLKLSGEALAGEQGLVCNPDVVEDCKRNCCFSKIH